MIDVREAAVGTAHPSAVCCWCNGPLTVQEQYGYRCWGCPRHMDRQMTYALAQTDKSGKKVSVFSVPLPSQVAIHEAPARNILWGGRAGPGKSKGIRDWMYARAIRIEGYQGLLLRENWDQLDKHHLREMERDASVLRGAHFFKQDRKLTFGSGSKESVIDAGHMADDTAVTRYRGLEYHDICPDEASLYPLDSDGAPVLAELSTRARLFGRDRVTHQQWAPRFVPVTNPGGPTARWLREMFIDKAPNYDMFPHQRPVYNEAGEQVSGYRPEQWQYIEAFLTGNPYIAEDYQSTLAVLSGVRYRQLAEGDWDAFSGQFFSTYSASVHVAEARIAA